MTLLVLSKERGVSPNAAWRALLPSIQSAAWQALLPSIQGAAWQALLPSIPRGQGAWLELWPQREDILGLKGLRGQKCPVERIKHPRYWGGVP